MAIRRVGVPAHRSVARSRSGGRVRPPYFTIEFPKWTPPLHAFLDGQEVELIGPDGTASTLSAAELEKLIGEFLVSVLKSARSDGLFNTMPKAERCELGVEESGGSFAWPIYKERGKENLA